MISENEMNLIIECAKKYNVFEIILFGSAVTRDDHNDIDIGVKGLKPELFFEFWGELGWKMAKNLDIIDLSEETQFNKIIMKRGIKIYG